MLIARAEEPWYPFGPEGKEKGDLTSARLVTVSDIAIRFLLPWPGQEESAARVGP